MTDPQALRDLGDHPVWVRISGVTKRYAGRTVLSDVDVCFRPGRVTAVIGPNGAGKTTLMKALLGLVRPDAGVLRMGDEVLTGTALYRRQVGYMPQLPRFPGNLTGHELAAMLDDLRGLRGKPDERLVEDLGLRSEMDKPFKALSGGNRQKLNAALAFRYETAVLVLDEPTAGLDPVAARVLKERIREERDDGCTVLLTSHDLGQLQALADDVVFLLDGEVRFEGELGQLSEVTEEVDLEAAIAALILGRAASTAPTAAPSGDGADTEGVA